MTHEWLTFEISWMVSTSVGSTLQGMSDSISISSSDFPFSISSIWPFSFPILKNHWNLGNFDPHMGRIFKDSLEIGSKNGFWVFQNCTNVSNDIEGVSRGTYVPYGMYLPIFLNDKSIIFICFLHFGFFSRATRIGILVLTSESIQETISKSVSKCKTVSESISKYIGNISNVSNISSSLSLGISNDVWQGLCCCDNRKSWSWNSWRECFFTMLAFAVKKGVKIIGGVSLDIHPALDLGMDPRYRGGKISHDQGSTYLWELRWSLRRNRFPQWGHSNGFKPVWMNWCLIQLLLSVNLRPQT